MRIAFWAAAFVTGFLTFQQAEKLERRPPLKEFGELESPKTYVMRNRVDSRTGQAREYDPQPKIVPVSLTKGTYRLQWIGYDGNVKSLAYERPDRLDATVSADVRTLNGRYRYSYRVSLASKSVQGLARFVVQNFARDVTQIAQVFLHEGTMGNTIDEFRTGEWRSFAPMDGYEPSPTSGHTLVFELESTSPPGVVGFRIAGARGGLDGVGEEPPFELLAALPHYKAWPVGLTIGPTESLATQTAAERRQTLARWIQDFAKAGWITKTLATLYTQPAASGNLSSLRARVDTDLRAGGITEEVAAVMRYLLR